MADQHTKNKKRNHVDVKIHKTINIMHLPAGISI